MFVLEVFVGFSRVVFGLIVTFGWVGGWLFCVLGGIGFGWFLWVWVRRCGVLGCLVGWF